MDKAQKKIARWLRTYKLEEIEVDSPTEDGIIPWDKCNQRTKNHWLQDARELIKLLKELGYCEGKPPFTTIEQFEEHHFPEYCRQYPIRMRVTEEEERLIRFKRGEILQSLVG